MYKTKFSLTIEAEGETLEELILNIQGQLPNISGTAPLNACDISFPLVDSSIKWIKAYRGTFPELSLSQCLNAFASLPVNHPDIRRLRAHCDSFNTMTAALKKVIDNNLWDERFE